MYKNCSGSKRNLIEQKRIQQQYVSYTVMHYLYCISLF